MSRASSSAIDAGKRTLTIGGKEGDRTFEIGKDAKITINDGKGDKSSLKESKLANLPVGALVSLRLSLDGKEVVALSAEGRNLDGVLKAVDSDKRTITLTTGSKGEPSVDHTLEMSKDARITIDDGREGKFAGGKEGKLTDIPVEARVSVKLSLDQKVVSVYVAAPQLSGVVKGNAGANQVTLLAGKGPEQTYNVAKGVRVLAENDREIKLADLIDGTVISGKLSPDRSQLIGTIRAEGPSFRGVVKGVDAGKGTITLTVNVKKGGDGEDRTFPVTKQTQIVTEVYGIPVKLADIRVDREAMVRLALDQKAAVKVTVLGE